MDSGCFGCLGWHGVAGHVREWSIFGIHGDRRNQEGAEYPFDTILRLTKQALP